jgi:choline dehydrogenase-like flavoprotein
MESQNLNYDVIVVGTGPGGATTARELTRQGKRVLLLEWGPGGPVRGNFLQYLTEQLIPGKSLLITNRFLGMVRGITLGGSSLFYYGTAFEVPFAMLKKHGIDIKKDVSAITEDVPVNPLTDEMMTPMAKRIMESARELGHDWNKLNKFMYLDRWKPEYRFGYFGDPHDVKWSARMFALEAEKEGAHLLTNAKVKRVLIAEGGAEGVEFTRNGKTMRAFAERIVLSAGGIGTPVILRKSGIEDVGLDYFFDPLISVCGTVNDIKKQHNEIPMSAGVHCKDEGYMMTDMALPGILDFIFTSQVFRFHRFNPAHTMRIMVKAKDSLGGRLTDSGGVRKKLADEDRDKLLHGYGRAKEILENAGAKGVYKTWYLAAHPGGTVKAGEHLDDRLMTRFKNLHVCDCSVIPEPWGLPPTLTLLGLGRYLARNLFENTAEKTKPGKSITKTARKKTKKKTAKK